ncbi:putative folic acid synthesis protein [Thermochaetoides thermophila DSM 1495]|uniref:Folic acid synthesis protein FOL1 n=1 Tax=Chaetomium thermophilum (strain DSM 1495 / CBS 144.50 / IMI 039719) TaxID=759272 RepID=G0S8M7_CHATD|nr:putative folic acid synthesis protein [Thermochaetoides thermophila DSM 1495]EGS21987.1 putative folic acid synthesis protein [Thermochaetoides thermophila DSM 1495]
MKRVALVATQPLRPSQALLSRARCVCRCAPVPRLARTDRRPLSTTARRPDESNSNKFQPFRRYTFPPDFCEKNPVVILPPQKPKMNGPELPERRTAYIALGSNMGDRIGWIEKACREMDARGIKVKRTSGLWETEPMYVLDQDRFVNGACEVETTLEPLELLDALQDIERALGRQKVIDKGPRNIDLDILLYENIKFNHERLKIPHVGIPEREFVLRPLAEYVPFPSTPPPAPFPPPSLPFNFPIDTPRLIPDKPIDPDRPWRLIRDYLDALPPSKSPITTMTPLSAHHSPIQALNPARKTHVMAILNVTPDSFSDGGTHSPSDPDSLVQTITSFLDAGATMIDIGGQSTAPGAPEVSLEEELSRVLPAIRLIRTHPSLSSRQVLISVDTYRAAVAEAAISAGADIVNDVSGGSLDPAMLPTVARLGATICLMHMRGTPATMNDLAVYPPEKGGLIGGIATELLARVKAAEEAGIRRWRIVLDPGLGFAKRGPQNVEVLRRLEELRAWPGLQGLPWLVGSSRKSFIGQVTGVPTPRERIWGTAATVAAAVQGGADVVRVHDVREMVQVVAMADAIWRY